MVAITILEHYTAFNSIHLKPSDTLRASCLGGEVYFLSSLFLERSFVYVRVMLQINTIKLINYKSNTKGEKYDYKCKCEER